MAAGCIREITVEINGDTTGLSKALSGVNKEIRSTQSQFRDAENLLKLEKDTSYKGLRAVSFTLKDSYKKYFKTDDDPAEEIIYRYKLFCSRIL